ncbi:oligogalacturonate lyase family protein [Massilia sp. TWP1-3-3]|uniref:oligogalacturonate lyase family protein n=1 Tax=Massilia sp. TWP1-3-3 TaxID=2804573 RepID=UPI003CF11BC9
MSRNVSFGIMALALVARVASGAEPAVPPTTWIDKDTGHRVWRLTPEPGSSSLYFNYNAFTPDGKSMVYNSPAGIHALDMASRKTRLLVPAGPGRNRPHTISVGQKTNSVFYLKTDSETKITSIYSASFDTGLEKKLVELPAGKRVDSINADETLAAGTFEPVSATPRPPQPKTNSKGAMMEQRLASRTPLVLFTINLQTGKVTELLQSRDWVNHLLFSPTDPTLLMYCHEGPWQKVDRIWTIRTDGSQNTLVHKRTMAMEIAGHEWWGKDGKTIWYDWQYPKGVVFYVAGVNIDAGKRTAYSLQRNEWSIHYNATSDLALFAGDGGDPGQVAKAPDGQWIQLFRPQKVMVPGATDEPGYVQGGVFKSERLVNMAKHDYRLEPNVRFSPDNKMVIFRTNMFGPSYVLGVGVDRE